MSDHPLSPWAALRRLTPARIGLGHSGISLPTQPQLDFQLAHAQARDAVHQALDRQALAEGLAGQDRPSLLLQSAAADRQTYLQRPDLGRRLHPDSAALLDDWAASHPQGYDLAIVIADGLSALAVQRHSLPFLDSLYPLLAPQHWSVAPISLVAQGRVALADEVGARLKAKMTLILIGERPGLSSPDSLGLYFTYAPEVGLTDARRNCISNVRLQGLSYASAAHRLQHLMIEACRRQLSGVQLKDETELPTLTADGQSAPSNFLLPLKG